LMGLFGALYPAYIYLCRTLRLRSCNRPRMTRGQDGSLLLIPYDSFIHDSTPVYPDAPQSRALDPQPSQERMKIMATHTSATPREEKSHSIDASLKRRARLLTTNSSIPGQTRSLIRYALEINDPYLGQLVRRVEAGEATIDHVHLE